MTKEYFKSLDLGERLRAILEQGELLYRVTKGNEKFLLYSMGSFFAEMVYDPETNNLLRLALLINGPELDKYSELENELE